MTAALPREVAEGVHWLSTCLILHDEAGALHTHNSAFLVKGERGAILIDTGMPSGWPVLARQLATALGDVPLTHLLPTHPELPHMGNLPRLLEEHPGAELVGDLRNYHLILPGFSRLRARHLEGDARIDLGGRSVLVTEAAIHDLPNTRWAFDECSRTLFTSDAFAYSHPHRSGECALMSHELVGRPTPADAAFVIAQALHWPRFVPAEQAISRLDAYLDRFRPAALAPAHGGFVSEPGRLREIYARALRDIHDGAAELAT